MRIAGPRKDSPVCRDLERGAGKPPAFCHLSRFKKKKRQKNARILHKQPLQPGPEQAHCETAARFRSGHARFHFHFSLGGGRRGDSAGSERPRPRRGPAPLAREGAVCSQRHHPKRIQHGHVTMGNSGRAASPSPSTRRASLTSSRRPRLLRPGCPPAARGEGSTALSRA